MYELSMFLLRKTKNLQECIFGFSGPITNWNKKRYRYWRPHHSSIVCFACRWFDALHRNGTTTAADGHVRFGLQSGASGRHPGGDRSSGGCHEGVVSNSADGRSQRAAPAGSDKQLPDDKPHPPTRTRGEALTCLTVFMHL